MDTCGVLIVGAGPSGSACAWKLRGSGLDVSILDKQVFPRDKVCGGWITPAVLAELQIDSREYARGRVMQPITGFRTGCIDGPSVFNDYGAAVSYGIRRREFDQYLLERSGAKRMEGVNLSSLERNGSQWIVNGTIRAKLLLGAGGHFCPVARLTGARPKGESAIVAQETEFEMDSGQQAACSIQGEVPELYFCADLKGYGWCFRKGNYLNIGLGRMDPHQLSSHVAGFVRFLKNSGRISFDLPKAMAGHAYLLYGPATRNVVADGLMLIGDAAGLAYAQSGEGIRPAIESGLLAAKAIIQANGDYHRLRLEPYRTMLAARFGESGSDWASSIGRRLPDVFIRSIGRRLLGLRWFARQVILNRWFLHSGEPALIC